MVKIFGLSNRLDKNHKLFFYEFDKVQRDDIIKESVRLSQEFDMNLFVFLSSKDSYHFVSFDVMKKDTILRIQRNIRIPSDYIPFDEQKLYGNFYADNCLRLSYKGIKTPPSFCYMVEALTNRPIAINHLLLYKEITGIPQEIIELFMNRNNLVPYSVNYVVYRTMTTPRKKWFGGCVRKGENY